MVAVLEMVMIGIGRDASAVWRQISPSDVMLAWGSVG